MSNFRKLAKGIPVTAALAEVIKNDYWNWLNLRRLFLGSCHREVDDVVMRFAKIDYPATMMSVMDDLSSVSYAPWYLHPKVTDLIFTEIRKYLNDNLVPLGRVMVTKLRPGGRIYPHRDEGGYARVHMRFHLALQSGGAGCVFRCGTEKVTMATGELWWFDHEKEHEVINDESVDRIHLIADFHR